MHVTSPLGCCKLLSNYYGGKELVDNNSNTLLISCQNRILSVLSTRFLVVLFVVRFIKGFSKRTPQNKHEVGASL